MTRKHTHFLWGVALATIIGSGALMVSDAQASVVVRTIDTSMPEAINETVLSEVTRTNSVEVARVNTKIKLALDKTRAEQKRQEEQKAKEEAERKAKEEAERKAKKEAERKAQEQAQTAEQYSAPTPVATELQFGADGLLVMQASGRAQQVVNLLLGIPGHSNGAGYHQSTGLDGLISQLSTAEAIWVLHRIEGAGFGQTGDGYAGMDTPASHRAVVANQINRRFSGSIHALLYAWGTYSYGGY